MELKNIKISLLFAKDLIDNMGSKLSWKHNNFYYTIYQFTRKLLNITGLKSKADVEKQKISMEKLFCQKVVKIRIDNVFFSQKNSMNIDMKSLYSHVRGNDLYFVNYNIEIFAGLHLQPKIKHHPTIVIFRTGSYQIMGGSSVNLCYKSELFVKNLIYRFDKS